MIALIKGEIAYKGIAHTVIDVNGVGYRVFIPLTTFYELPEAGQPVALYVHTHVKEDAINLFGFYTIEERDLFQLLISVNGVGPKLAMNILSGISVRDLLLAIAESNVGRMTGIPGVGKKIAERLILELKDKIIKKMAAENISSAEKQQKTTEIVTEDVLSALVNLGYKNNTAKDAVARVLREAETVPAMDQLLKKALKMLAG
ncbi:MAG TPA: Holliday junction branch migration protein RuvA [Smithellaceae bacterium]|nr:Holliday junction branch migration protein RuvA [Smithellaceae bacterium]